MKAMLKLAGVFVFFFLIFFIKTIDMDNLIQFK